MPSQFLERKNCEKVLESCNIFFFFLNRSDLSRSEPDMSRVVRDLYRPTVETLKRFSSSLIQPRVRGVCAVSLRERSDKFESYEVNQEGEPTERIREKRVDEALSQETAKIDNNGSTNEPI